jgi:hypothetical protein
MLMLQLRSIDLLYASLNGQPPAYREDPLFPGLEACAGILGISDEVDRHDTQGRGFVALHSAGHIDSLFRDLMYDLIEIDYILSARKGLCNDPVHHPQEALTALGMSCWIERRILCLPSQSEPVASASSPSSAVYECCRATAALYSTAVVYSLPFDRQWHLPFLVQLRCVFARSDLLTSTDPAIADVVLWSLCVASIASSASLQEVWFQKSFCQVCFRRGLRHWDAVQEVLTRFVWSDGACEQGTAVLRGVLAMSAPGTHAQLGNG